MTLANGVMLASIIFHYGAKLYIFVVFEILLGDYFNRGSGGLKIIYGGIKI